MKRLFILFSLGATLILPQAYAANPQEELRECAGIGSDSKRLDCYDDLTRSLETKVVSKPKEKPKPPPQPERASNQSPPPITDDVGMDKPRESFIEEEFTVFVDRCESLTNSRRLVFYLDNGQVWQQKNERRVSKRNCKSEGVISKDFFGYRLYIKSKDTSVRVSRLR